MEGNESLSVAAQVPSTHGSGTEAVSWTLGGSSFAVVWGTSRVSGASGASLNTFMVTGAGVVGQ